MPSGFLSWIVPRQRPPGMRMTQTVSMWVPFRQAGGTTARPSCPAWRRSARHEEGDYGAATGFVIGFEEDFAALIEHGPLLDAARAVTSPDNELHARNLSPRGWMRGPGIPA